MPAIKKISTIMFLVVLLTACAPQTTTTSGGGEALTRIRLPMGYIPDVQFTPLYVSSELGFFREVGLEVEFDYGFDTDGITLVGGGQLPFALVSGEQVLLARAQDLPVVYVAAWYQDYPIAVVAKRSSGITEIEDLVGKRIGLPVLFGSNYIGLRALLDFVGIPESQVTLSAIGYNQVEVLALDQQDAVVVYTNNEPVQLRAQGYDINMIIVSDYLMLASNGLITNEQTIAENPDLVRRMVSAFVRGINYASTHPEQAYEIGLQYVENLAQADQAIQKEILDVSIGIWEAERLGLSDPKAWENMQQTLLNIGMLQAPLDLTQAYTNEFIP
jgi:NitT/TauT family transport system substrate-binding protein